MRYVSAGEPVPSITVTLVIAMVSESVRGSVPESPGLKSKSDERNRCVTGIKIRIRDGRMKAIDVTRTE
jgi:hypothetical protein